MLLTKNLIENVDEQFIPMLKMVNIPDFTKCIAQFSGLSIENVSDDQIKEYLLVWARNKYRFFKLFKDKLRYDSEITYSYSRQDIEEEMMALERDYPVYTPWLRGFQGLKKNKIETDLISWDVRSWARSFEKLNLEGTSLTRFFKHYLNAPDMMVTRIGKIFELDNVKSSYTLSIDPVDMMLASEAIYGTGSCYRLATGCPDSHADGCIAALLDDTHTIAYVWDEEKAFSLYGKYKFKAIRYKKVRQWVSISPSMKSIHFNSTYPTESRNREDLTKALRTKVEELIAAHLNIENSWKKAENADVEREYYYGYSEYCSEYVYEHSSLGEKSEGWCVFTEPYKCPCGCEKYLTASGDLEDEYDSEICYNGDGFCCENFYSNELCEYSGNYCRYACDCCYDCCCDCYAWQDTHPVCGVRDIVCPDGIDDTCDGVVNCCEDNCKGCLYWKEYKKEIKEDEEE